MASPTTTLSCLYLRAYHIARIRVTNMAASIIIIYTATVWIIILYVAHIAMMIIMAYIVALAILCACFMAYMTLPFIADYGGIG